MIADPKAKAVTEAIGERADARAGSGSGGARQRIGKLRWTIDFSHESPERQQARARLLRLLQEGIDSGMSDRSVPGIWEDVKARLKAKGKL